MASINTYPYDQSLRQHLRNCPKTGVHVPSPSYNRNRAQYYDLSILNKSFGHYQRSQDGNVVNPPSAHDPYSQAYDHIHYYPQRNIGNVLHNYYPQTYGYQQAHPKHVSFGGNRVPAYNQGQVYPSQNDRLSDKRIEDIRNTAKNYVQNCCPLLGEKPYCLPPIKRYRHPDKSNKKLIQGMESEKRVFGTFERFFVEQNIPVFMLCHYPLSGFLNVFKTEHLDKALMTLNGHSGKNTVMLLLSRTFAVTIVSVSITNGNSQFDHLRHRVLKTITQMKEISSTVSKWLTLLGVRSEVRQVIAFPNLRRVVMDRVCKDKQLQHSIGSFCTLHVDELSAPFEEEWSDPVRKQQFHMWMLQNVLSYDCTLSQNDLNLVVGALLSPKLSKVDFVQEDKMIMPISESIHYTDTEEGQSENVGQMKLTIDGVTKSFDEFMDQYVSSYYPNVGERTYRVPPIHFNIQSLKKPSEYLRAFKGDSLLQTINEGPGNKASKDLENHLSYQCKIVPSGENTNSNFQRETNQFKSYPQSSISAGKNSNPRGQGDSFISTIDQSEHRLSNTLQISSDCTGGRSPFQDSDSQDSDSQDFDSLDSDSQRSSPDRFILSSGICFKESPNSSSSLLCADTSANITSLQNITSASYMRRELSDSSLSVGQTPSNAILQSVQDVEILSKVMDKDIRKDEGENRVINALEMLGHQSNLGGQQEDPMFIICGYQYNNYLNKLREEMFSKEDINRPVRAFGQTMRAEHDCLIFHKKYGAIIVCIKAIGDNFEEWHATEGQKIACTKTILEKALKQVEREEAMIRHVTSDLPIKLKCHKLIALPNMSRESVKTALWTDLQLKKRIRDILGHEADLFLCSDELPPKNTAFWDCSDELPPNQTVLKNSPEAKVNEKLISWWKRVKIFLEEVPDSKIELPEYKQLIGRYCGLFSTVEVWSPSNPRMEVRSASEAVKTCAERFCKIVLLPCQLKALCSNHERMFLYGPPGSGKTLVLMLKAKQWLLAGKTVVLINSRCGSNTGFPYAYGIYNRLVHMMLESNVPLNTLSIVNIDPLKFKEAELASITPYYCVIMDEVTPSSHKIIELLCSRQVSSIWCGCIFYEDMPKTTHFFATHKMDKIIRCPPAVQSILRHTEEAVRLRKPYEKVYQRSIMEQEHCMMLNNENYNKFNDFILKSHVAYYSELQKGKRKYSKLETSQNSRLSSSSLLKLKFKIQNELPDEAKQYIKTRFKEYTNSFKKDTNSFKEYIKHHRGQLVDNIWKKDPSYCSEKQTENPPSESLSKLFGLICSPEARLVYKQILLQTENIKRYSSACLDDKLAESTDLSKEMLLRGNSLQDDLCMVQFSDYISKAQHQDMKTKANKIHHVIEMLNYVLSKDNKQIQIIEASSDSSKQQRGHHLTEPHSANNSAKVPEDDSANNSAKLPEDCTLTTLETKELRYNSESVNNRHYTSQQQTADQLTEPHSANNSAKLPEDGTVTTLETKELKYNSESVNNRHDTSQQQTAVHLTELYSANNSAKLPEDGTVTTLETKELKYNSESVNNRHDTSQQQTAVHLTELYSANNSAKVPEDGTVITLETKELKYDSESVNKRLIQKYSKQGNNLHASQNLDSDSESVNNRHNISQKQTGNDLTEPHSANNSAKVLEDDTVTTLETKELKYDSESVNKRLIQKYSQQDNNFHASQNLDSNSESVNKRLIHKYSQQGNNFHASQNLDSDSESVIKRPMQNYGQRCTLISTDAPRSEIVPHDTLSHEVQPMSHGDIKYDQDSLEKRLAEKYSSGHHGRSEMSSSSYKSKFHFTILQESEALNKRLGEKYNGCFIKRSLELYQQEAIQKPKRLLFNNNNAMSMAGVTQNGFLPGCLGEENKNNVSKSSQDNLNTRVEKYGRKSEQPSKQLATSQFCHCSSHNEMSLPSDGPQPNIIDHSLHSKSGNPIDCMHCAHELLQFLNTMIRPDDKPIFPKRKQNFYETKLLGRGTPESGHSLLSSASSVYTKLPKSSFFHTPGVFENRALSWSDVLIVAKEVTQDCVLIKVLKSNNIPVEVCLGDKAHRIEDPKERKLFITSYKETTGIERAIIIFIPSEGQASSLQVPGKDSNIDLKLSKCINRFSEDDKAALWFVASRSLASLVLILP